MSDNNNIKKQEEEAISNSEIYSEKTEKEPEKEEQKEEINESKKEIENENNEKNESKNEEKENNEDKDNNEDKENNEISEVMNNNEENNKPIVDENGNIEIEVMDRGMNTDELSERELNRLINENKELLENNNNEKNICHVEHDTKTDITPNKRALMEELTKNDEVYDILLQSNNELNSKIKMSLKKYQDIIDKIEEKKSENIERKLTLKIKELEKEIKANNSETERYKKLIEQLKDKIEFQENIDRASNIQKLLKQENLKNKELKNRLNTLIKINKVQSKYIENYDKKHKTQEKVDKLKDEIQQNKIYIKDYTNKYLKLDRFTKIAHEKILNLKIYVKKIIQEPKIEEKKIFTNEETKDTLGVITNLKNQIIEKRKELSEIQKKSEIKIHELLVKNKQIELEYLENEKINKNLIYRKNELNKKLRILNNEKNKNKQIVQKINLNPIIVENDKNLINENNENKENNENLINSENENKNSKSSERNEKDSKTEEQSSNRKSEKSTKRKKRKKKEDKKEEEKKEEKKEENKKEDKQEKKNEEEKKDKIQKDETSEEKKSKSKKKKTKK